LVLRSSIACFPPQGERVCFRAACVGLDVLDVALLLAATTVISKGKQNVRDATGKLRSADVVETTAVVVAGFTWAYQPQAKP
jgi:hypothetical protein